VSAVILVLTVAAGWFDFEPRFLRTVLNFVR
jgi:hypothetical protein